MMAEYITLEQAAEAFAIQTVFSTIDCLDMLYYAIQKGWISPSNVAPVVHGRWLTHSDRPDSLICSVCKCGFDMWKHDQHNYCPNCGAKMDGGAE